MALSAQKEADLVAGAARGVQSRHLVDQVQDESVRL